MAVSPLLSVKPVISGNFTTMFTEADTPLPSAALAVITDPPPFKAARVTGPAESVTESASSCPDTRNLITSGSELSQITCSL